MPIPLAGPVIEPPLPFLEPFALVRAAGPAAPALPGLQPPERSASQALSPTPAPSLAPSPALRSEPAPARRVGPGAEVGSGDTTHVVRPGETLAGIAARHELSPAQLRGANALVSSHIRPGQRLTIPGGMIRARHLATAARARAAGVRTCVIAALPGDTVAGIAARHGVGATAILKANDLPMGARLTPGQTLRIPGSCVPVAPSVAASAEARRLQRAAAINRAYLQSQTVPNRTATHRLIAGEARRQGVPAALAVAIGWQESHWNQRQVSERNAIGVMQCLPSTAAWVSRHVGYRLDLLDTDDNITCGVGLLRALVRSAADEDEVIAGYAQGLASVRDQGMRAETVAYVTSVHRNLARLADS